MTACLRREPVVAVATAFSQKPRSSSRCWIAAVSAPSRVPTPTSGTAETPITSTFDGSVVVDAAVVVGAADVVGGSVVGGSVAVVAGRVTATVDVTAEVARHRLGRQRGRGHRRDRHRAGGRLGRGRAAVGGRAPGDRCRPERQEGEQRDRPRSDAVGGCAGWAARRSSGSLLGGRSGRSRLSPRAVGDSSLRTHRRHSCTSVERRSCDAVPATRSLRSAAARTRSSSAYFTPDSSCSVWCGWVTSDGHTISVADVERGVVDALPGEVERAAGEPVVQLERGAAPGRRRGGCAGAPARRARTG